jgi:hypothetical protein
MTDPSCDAPFVTRILVHASTLAVASKAETPAHAGIRNRFNLISLFLPLVLWPVVLADWCVGWEDPQYSARSPMHLCVATALSLRKTAYGVLDYTWVAAYREHWAYSAHVGWVIAQ